MVTFANPHILWLLPCLLVGSMGLWRLSRTMARHKLSHFAPPERLERLCASLDNRVSAKKFRLICSALSLLVLTMARPMLSPRATTPTTEGCAFFFVLDVSKSMLVRDLEPNRLESVKASLLRWMKTRRGDRIGLILLAGDAFVQAPLTHDLVALRAVLEQSGPSSISKGGTHIAGAMEATIEALKKSGMPNPVAVLISDGGATEGNALEVLEKARKQGPLVLHVVGVGTSQGGLVPAAPKKGKSEDFSKPPEGYVTDDYGLRVTSRLDERSLRLLASAGGGRYFSFEPDGETWDRLYTLAIQPDARQKRDGNFKDFVDLYQWPLLLALALFFYESRLSLRIDKKTRSIIAFLLSLFAVSASAEEGILTPAEAQKKLTEGKAAEIGKLLWDAAQREPENLYHIYNFGIASYAMGNFSDAVNAFTEASRTPEEKLRALAIFQLGNVHYRMGQSLAKTSNSEGALVSWERAVEYYELSASREDSADAKHNLRVAKTALEKKLLETAEKLIRDGKLHAHPEKHASFLARALEKLEKAQALAPENADTTARIQDIRKLLSETLAAQARHHRAEAEKLSGDPRKAGVQAALHEKAKQSYAEAIAFAPDDQALAAESAAFQKAVSDRMADEAEAIRQESSRLPTGDNAREGDWRARKDLLKKSLARADAAVAFDETNQRAKSLRDQVDSELEQTLEARADLLTSAGDSSVAKKSSSVAVNQFGDAAEDYRTALAMNPENARVQTKLENLERKLAAALASAAVAEMAAAEKNTARPPTGTGDPGDSPPMDRMQDAIGQLEKAVALLDQSEALAPAKNNAAELTEQAVARLQTIRGQMDQALGKNQNPGGPPSSPTQSPSDSPSLGEGGQPLNFSEIASSSNEREGQFRDKTKKERIRDW